MKKLLDLSSHEDVRGYAAGILQKLTEGSMPCDGAWPDEQVDLFRRWVEDGRNP